MNPALPLTTSTARPLSLSSGALEALKWLALAAMLLDHVNKWLYAGRVPLGFELGRLAWPLFAFVLAHHLAQPGALEGALPVRLLRRLLGWGLLATPPFMALAGSWFPLNILFSLAAATIVVWGLARRDVAGAAAALACFALAGQVVDYQHPGLAMCVAAWYFCRAPSAARAAVWACFVAGLVVVNNNFWALLALPVAALAAVAEPPLPRLRWVFYAAYPLHLAVIWWLRSA